MRCPRIGLPACLPWRLLTLCLLVAGAAAGRSQTASVPPVNVRDRTQVCDFYRQYYLPFCHAAPGWTGSVAGGNPGTVSPEYLRATLRRINYFRAMSGLLGNVTFDAANNARCQQAALMMAAERLVSHSPARNWRFYNRDAALAAAHSDLDLNWRGDLGPAAIDRYMSDFGALNACVGHRRWLLSAGTTVMGAGIIPPNGTVHPGINVTWIMDGPPRLIEVSDDAPAAAPPSGPTTSWPPAGFVPAALVYDRWSFSLPYADFRRARVSVLKEGRALTVVPEKLAYQCAADGSGPNLGANTLVWTLPGNAVCRSADETYRVQVSNVLVAGQPRDFVYTVTSIDPAHRGRGDGPLPGDGVRLAANMVLLSR